MITMQQAKEEMKHFRKVFSVVRLLEKSETGEMQQVVMQEGVEDECADMEICPCYKLWGKGQPCENCTSLKAVNEKTQKTKLELIDSEMYHVFSRYMEIDGKPYVMELAKNLDMEVLSNISGYERIVEKIESFNEKLYCDALTGVYNRRYYEDKIKKLVINAGVAIIDLDDFKFHNDTYGHNVGDMALKTLAGIIKECIRKTDILIRYGGDEFLLILPDVNHDVFSKKLIQIQNSVNATVIPECVSLKLSVSIGGVISEDQYIEYAIEHADKLMYIAKTKKNMVVTDGDDIVSEDGRIKAIKMDQIKPKILIVDDAEINREILSEILSGDYMIFEASNGEECMKVMEQHGSDISLILLDIIMPVMDGFEVLAYMNRNHMIEDTPVIMISSEDSASCIRRAYELGVSDYISRPFDSNIVYKRVLNMIKLYSKQRRLTSLVTQQIYEKEKNNQMMVGILSQIVEFRNGESGRHVLHIKIITRLILERLAQKTDKYLLSWSDQYLISTASALHDIGKIGIDEKILNKAGRLTDEEFEIMKSHTLIGASMLESLELYKDEMLIKLAYQICRWHHERYDGNGYPDGLKGDEIPMAAQVVSLADVYDALVSRRVYKEAFSHDKAMKMILSGECGAFNPLLLECLAEVQQKICDEINHDGLVESEWRGADMDIHIDLDVNNSPMRGVSGTDNMIK